jgi:hypothetical protein
MWCHRPLRLTPIQSSCCGSGLPDLQKDHARRRLTQTSAFLRVSYSSRSISPLAKRASRISRGVPDRDSRLSAPLLCRRDMLIATIRTMTRSPIQNKGPNHIPPPPQPMPQSFIMTKLQVRVRRRKPRRSQVEQAASECTQSRWRCPELENPEFAWLLQSRLILAPR